MGRGEREVGGGGRFRRDPHPSLRPFVVEYWGMARDLGAMGGFTITPDCFGEFLCCSDDLYAIVGDVRAKLPSCFVVGLLGGPLRIESPGVVRCLSARLRPWSVGRFFAGASEPATRGWVDVEDVFGPLLPRVVQRVERCDWDSVATIFDELLREVAGRWKAEETGDDLVGPFLGGAPGATGRVARDRQTSNRQVERRVRALTGTSPKQLACLARFQKARDALWAEPDVDLSRLAAVAGYSDQPHLTREFRRYAGQTPARFAREMAAMKIWLGRQDVAFVQEPADQGT